MHMHTNNTMTVAFNYRPMPRRAACQRHFCDRSYSVYRLILHFSIQNYVHVISSDVSQVSGRTKKMLVVGRRFTVVRSYVRLWHVRSTDVVVTERLTNAPRVVSNQVSVDTAVPVRTAAPARNSSAQLSPNFITPTLRQSKRQVLGLSL